MGTLFDDPDGRFLVVVNDVGQYSLWPGSLPVPEGWAVAHGEDTRASCLDYVDRTWTDLANSAVQARHD